MAGRGRSRGRGLLAAKPTTPGGGNEPDAKASAEAVPKKDVRAVQALKDIESELDILLDSANDPTEEDLDRFAELAVLAMASLDEVQAVAKLLYERAVNARMHSKTIAIICDRLSSLEKEGIRFRSTLLGLVQVDYERRKELHAQAKSQFLGCVAFLSHTFGTLRLPNGEVFLVLVGPIYDCMELIIDSNSIDDTDTDCILSLLQAIGRDLQDHGEERMQTLMSNIRGKIIHDKITPQVRCNLLELLECYMRRWQLAPNDVTRFYLDTMAEIMAGLVV